MEPHVLPVLPSSDKEEVLCATAASATATTTTPVNRSAECHEPLEIHGMSMREVSDLMAQGEPMSFVIVGDGEDGLEWIDDSSVVVESPNVSRYSEPERIIVLDASGRGVRSSEASETMCLKPRLGEPVANIGLTETRKRTHSGFQSGQPVLKGIRLSHLKDQASKKTEVEIRTHKPDNRFHTFQVVQDGKLKLISSVSDKLDKNVYQSKNKPSQIVYPQEPSKIMVVKEGEPSVINVYGSSDSSSLSSNEGSISYVDVRKGLQSLENGVPEHQQITFMTSPGVIKIEDPMQMRKVFTSRDSSRDGQSILISSGANVELEVSSSVVNSEETRLCKQNVIRVSRESIDTGLVEGSVMYKCGECDYASPNKHYYKQHVDLVHNTARPYKCPFCDYAGKRGHALREHLIVHSAQRPYSCRHCNATFRKKGHLTNHTKHHAGTAITTLCASGLPGGLRGGSGPIQVTVGSSGGQVVRIPSVGIMDGNSSIITVKAEPSGRETTVISPCQTMQPVCTTTTTTTTVVMATGSRGSKLWCALCRKEMPDANLFQAHLKVVHGTDRLYACDRCEYVAANKGAILSHLALHIPNSFPTHNNTQATATAVPEHQRVVTVPVPPPSPAVNPQLAAASALFTCTHCGLSFPDLQLFIAHAVTHNVGAGVKASSAAAAPPSKIFSVPQSSQAQQVSKAMCTVCRHVADSMESMKAHLWTHIKVDPAAENKPRPQPQPQPLQELKKATVESTSAPQVVEQTTSIAPPPGPVGLPTVPTNTIFKCSECSYICPDGSHFVKHMLVHKTQQNQAPRIQVQGSTASAGAAPGTTATGVNNKPSTFSYKVKPITTENTCKNTESSPFVHDAARGRFRCVICGYTCEYQRTIKAHIWKHSGHHKVDYPIFQNGPLSMYEETTPSGAAAAPPPPPPPPAAAAAGKVSAAQPPPPPSPAGTAAAVQVEPPHLLTPQPAPSEPGRPPPPPLPAVVVSAASSTAGSVPVSVKFITVSGSQVLHSSGPLPSGSVKLIPVQQPTVSMSAPPPITTTTAARPPTVLSSVAVEGGRQVMVHHVQGSDGLLPGREGTGRRSGSVAAAAAMVPVTVNAECGFPGRGLVVVKREPASVSVKSVDPAPRVTLLSRAMHGVSALVKGVSGQPQAQVKGKDDVEPKVQPGWSGGVQASSKSLSQRESKSGAGDSTVDLGSGMDGSTNLPKVVVIQEGLEKTSSSYRVRTPTSCVVSAKHTLPLCAAVDKQQVRVAVPVHPQSEKPPCTVPAVSAAVTTVATPTYAANTLSSSSSSSSSLSSVTETHSKTSTPAVSKGILRSALTEEANNILAHQTRSGSSSTETNTHAGEKAPSPAGEDTAPKQKVWVSTERPAQETSLALAPPPEKPSGARQSAAAVPSGQSVVVEVVDAVPLNPGSYTGLLSQQTSPRLSRSSNGSPVPPAAHTDPKASPHAKAEQGEASSSSSRVLRSSKRKVNAEEKRSAEGATRSDESPQKRVCKTDQSNSEKLKESQTLQDSESAATLLSLQNRDPGGAPPPSYPLPLSRPSSRHGEQSLEQDLDSPDRSPSSSSETESVARETTGKAASENVSGEQDSVSGKNRAGGGGGGICSTLLAVIEQLRERSRSESDAEDKQSQPQVKKRAGRRRGRQESDEEVLEIQDSDNIEQLSGEEGVIYRCKLCHYTSPRVPLIRLHMRTHRQKDPFECSLCSVVADSSEALQEHIFQHCKVRTYACKFCPQAFNHKSTLRAHMRAHNDSEPYVCDLCDFESTNPLDYRAHMQKHTGSALLCCPHCPAVLASRQDLRSHQSGSCPSAVASSPTPTPPGTEGAETSDPQHDDAKEEQENVRCPKCDFTSGDRAQMEDHMTSHHHQAVRGVGGVEVVGGVEGVGVGGGLLRCALCDFTAVSTRSLKSHMKRHANDQRYVQQPLEQYKCLLCGYVCHHLPSLKSHMWRHAGHQGYSYHFTNDIINAAIDYDTRATDPQPTSSSSSARGAVAGCTTGTTFKESDDPDLLNKVLSVEQRIVEGQMSRQGGAGEEPVCWVTFRCCQCGFQTINKPKLNLHMRKHADIIQQALQVNSPSSSSTTTAGTQKESLAPCSTSVAASSGQSSDSANIKVVYGPV